MSQSLVSNLLPVSQADARISAKVDDFGTEVVPLVRAAGRVLREVVTAERHQPAIDRVIMDGIAIRSQAWLQGHRRYRLRAQPGADGEAWLLSAANRCVEVTTGAPLPDGCDSVIPADRLRRDGHHVVVADGGQVWPGMFVHGRATDHQRGTVLLQPGRQLSAPMIACAASAGVAELLVSRLPRVAVIATGTELVKPGEPIQAHQIRLSNPYAIQAALAGVGLDNVALLHIEDDPRLLRAAVSAALERYEVLLFSGGVSIGRYDYVPRILRDLDVRTEFQGVAQRPGRALLFATGPQRQIVFALPGNPVSATITAHRFVLPALRQAMRTRLIQIETAPLAEPWEFESANTLYLPVKIRSQPDGLLGAEPRATDSTRDFASLADTDGFLEMPPGRSKFIAGAHFPLHRWSPSGI